MVIRVTTITQLNNGGFIRNFKKEKGKQFKKIILESWQILKHYF